MADLTLASVLPDIAWTPFLIAAAILAVGMLLWDTIEVGRNDAANLVNAVIGARVLDRRIAIWLAGVAVVLGALASSSVIETARKGIFEPTQLVIMQALCVYVAVYIVDTVLLYGYSAFGMPVSTTACLVFELLGASFALGGFGVVKWGKAGSVVAAIICSIVITGVVAFMVQRVLRGAIGDRTKSMPVLLAHGGWAAGGMLAGLTYFMLVKGMKQVSFIKHLNEEYLKQYGALVTLLVLWVFFTIVVHLCLVIFGKAAARRLFPTIAIIGTIAVAFAFGQNDLANCASPGLAAVNLLYHWNEGVHVATGVEISKLALGVCGLLMALGMMTKNARRVTDSAIHAGSMAHQVRLWAPNWCVALARLILRLRGKSEPQEILAPLPEITDKGKRMHYDPLRACVILAVSASVIATASGKGLPVSTTYVSFAAIIATGAADRIFLRGDADLKLARTIWVIFSWFAAAVIAAVCAGLVCLLLYHAGVWGIVGGVGANLLVRQLLKRRADAQERLVREAARERKYPDQFSQEDEY